MRSAISNHVIDILQGLSQKSSCSHKHAAALVYNKTIICTAYNDWDSVYPRTCHAEIACVNRYIRDQKRLRKSINFNKLTLVVIRYKRYKEDVSLNTLKDSEPCVQCENALSAMGIKRIIYS